MLPTNGNRPASAGRGFTLVELMVGMSLSFVLIAVTLAAYTFVGRNLTRMANLQTLETTSRRTFYIFAKDVSKATQVNSASSTQLVLTLPTSSGTKTVTYSYSSGTLTRTSSPVDTADTADANTTLLTRVDTTATTPSGGFKFNYFDTSGNAITSTAGIKAIELEFTSAITNGSDNLNKSSYPAVSPRVVLSNRSLLP